MWIALFIICELEQIDNWSVIWTLIWFRLDLLYFKVFSLILLIAVGKHIEMKCPGLCHEVYGFFDGVGIIILILKTPTSRLQLILYQKSDFCGNRRHHRCIVFKSQGYFSFHLISISCTVWVVIPWHNSCKHKYFRGYSEYISNRINRDSLHLFRAGCPLQQWFW